jgi:hypothetical protein
VLGLYAAGSWVLLQVIDVLTQNIDLPPWVFTLTLTMLIIGLPITAATAYFQGIGRSSDGTGADGADGTASGDRADATSPRGLFTWGNVLKGGVAALALWGVAVTGWMVMGAQQTEESEWDLVTGLDEIRRLVGEYEYPGAYTIARELDGVISNDSVRESMWSEVSRTLTLETWKRILQAPWPSGATTHRPIPSGRNWVARPSKLSVSPSACRVSGSSSRATCRARPRTSPAAWPPPLPSVSTPRRRCPAG